MATRKVTNPDDSVHVTVAYGGSSGSSGLTKREFFAAVALKGMLANPDTGKLSTKFIVETSVAIADSLTEALNDEQKSKPQNPL